MPAYALLLGASIASLNLCTDEYLLLLARPQEIASVTMLSQDPLESPLWREGRRHRANNGSIEDVVSLRPGILLTMGGGGRATGMIARRIGIRAVDLRPAATLDDVERNFLTVAAALGDVKRAAPWINRLDRLRVTKPKVTHDAIWLSGGGQSINSDGLGAQWLRLAGFRQRPLNGDRASLETLLLRPPQILVQSDYRAGQVSSGTRWLDHPIVRNLKAQRIRTDGRAWTCLGPLMIAEIERLRHGVQ
jgi:iron complex transport system substrate-binding protein